MRIVGIDFGTRRIGLAVADPSLTLATPVETIAAGGTPAESAERTALSIRRLSTGDDPVGTIVVGVPRHLDGTPSEQTEEAMAFGRALGEALRAELVFIDERLTSREAEERLALRERDWRVRKKRLDAASAAVILQEYLDHRQPREPGTMESA